MRLASGMKVWFENMESCWRAEMVGINICNVN